MATQYTVPEEWVGKDLADLRKTSDQPWRTDIIANMLGVQERGVAFEPGQTLSYKSLPGMSNSAEEKYLQSIFSGQPTQQATPQGDAPTYQSISDTLQQGKTEAIGTLKSGKEDLKTRYDEVIQSIKDIGTERRGEAATATATEFGKRGIPLTSGVHAQALQKAYSPVDVAERSSLADVGLQSTQADQAINTAIANIQSATSRDQVDAAMRLYQIAENSRLTGMSLEQSAQQFDQQMALSRDELGFQKEQYEYGKTLPQYQAIGEGSTLMNLLTGQPAYTAPKTYKPSSSGGNDPLGLF